MIISHKCEKTMQEKKWWSSE